MCELSSDGAVHEPDAHEDHLAGAQGKTCFNFKVYPGPDVLPELKRLTEAGFKAFQKRKWL